jgi:hypothetical protein
VLVLYDRPEFGNPIGGHLGFQVENHLDLGERNPELAQRR